MQPTESKNRFEDTYGQLRPSKPQHDGKTNSDRHDASAQDKTSTTNKNVSSTKGPLFQLGVMLLLILAGAAALIIGGLFALVFLTVGLFLFLMKRLFIGSPRSSSLPRRR